MTRKLSVLVFLTACSVPNGDEWKQAVPDGRYQASPFVCTSTGEPPLFRKPEQQVVLYAFDELKTSSFILQNPDVWRTFGDDDCEVTVKTQVTLNSDGEFALRVGKMSLFTPQSCALRVTFGGTTLDVSAATSAYLADDSTDDRTTDVVFQVTENDTGYLLRSVQSEEMNKVWESFGCGAADTVEFALTR